MVSPCRRMRLRRWTIRRGRHSFEPVGEPAGEPARRSFRRSRQSGQVERGLPDVARREEPEDPARILLDVARVPRGEETRAADVGDPGIRRIAGARQLPELRDADRAALEIPGYL